MKSTLKLRLPFLLTKHPDPTLQMLWIWVQIGWLILPIHGITFGVITIGAMAQCVWQQGDRLNRSWLNQAFCILAFWIVGTMVVAEDFYTALLGMFNFVPFFLMFMLMSLVIQTIDQLRHLTRLTIATASVVAVLGIGQYFFGWQGPAQPWEGILGWALAPGGNPPGRMASVFMYANSMAGYLVMVLPLAIALWLGQVKGFRFQVLGFRFQVSGARFQVPGFRGQGSDDQSPNQHSDPLTPNPNPLTSYSALRTRHSAPHTPHSALRTPHPALRTPHPTPHTPHSAPHTLSPLLLPVLAILVCIVFTHSRNAWGIAALTCLAFAIYRGWYWILAVLGAAIAVIGAAAFAPTPISGGLRQVVPRFIWARLTDDLYPDRPIAELRSTQWEFAWWMTSQRPWTGWGFRSFTPLYEEKMQFFVGHPHNLFLMLTAEIGIPATVVLCGLVGWVLFRAVMLLWHWQDEMPGANSSDRLLVFGYLVAFTSCILFNCLDVTALDVRVNVVGWLLLSALAGIAQRKLG